MILATDWAGGPDDFGKGILFGVLLLIIYLATKKKKD